MEGSNGSFYLLGGTLDRHAEHHDQLVDYKELRTAHDSDTAKLVCIGKHGDFSHNTATQNSVQLSTVAVAAKV